MKKAILPSLILSLILTVILSSGCTLITALDKLDVLHAYTSENSSYKFYTFKAEIRSIRYVNVHYENESYFEFEVDHDYFQQAYGEDDDTYSDGKTRWEGDYSYFNEF